MDNVSLIGTVAFTNLLAAMSPGPDFVMAVKNSLTYSRRTGIFTGVGIGLGIGVHILYCAAGIGFIISKSIVLFTIIKIMGAAYLVYMGVNAIIAKKMSIGLNAEKISADLSRRQAVRIGFLTNLLNPKATLFFLGLFTFVINHDTPLYILLIIAIIMVFTAIGWFALVAVFFTHQKIRGSFLRFETLIQKTFGGLLILLGVKIALTR